MDNMLDPSWKELLVDGSLGKVYLLGASDFQRKALEEIDRYRKSGNYNEDDDGLKIAEIIIETLRYETNKG